MTRGEVAGALVGVTAVAGANWVIEQNFLPLVLAAAFVLVAVFLFRPVRPREVRAPNLPRSRSLPRSGSPGPRLSQSRRATKPKCASRRRTPNF